MFAPHSQMDSMTATTSNYEITETMSGKDRLQLLTRIDSIHEIMCITYDPEDASTRVIEHVAMKEHEGSIIKKSE